ncbi:MAG: hypothetical protein FWC02_02850 [Firmicutes bacterium]|nr:hypothetical protein [Bacillota bacterium]
MATAVKKRKKQGYFSKLGLRQLADLLMLVGAILIFIGLLTTNTVLVVGLAFYIVAALIAIFRVVRVMLSGISKKSPEFKRALINAIVMALILGLAIFGFIYALV